MPKSLDNAGVGPKTMAYIFTPTSFCTKLWFHATSYHKLLVLHQVIPLLFFLIPYHYWI